MAVKRLITSTWHSNDTCAKHTHTSLLTHPRNCITTQEIVHVINILHVIKKFELRTPTVALCTCIIIYDSVLFKLFIYKIYYVYNKIVCIQSVHMCTIKWYMNKVCCMYRFMFVMCPICYRTNMFYNSYKYIFISAVLSFLHWCTVLLLGHTFLSTVRTL